MGEGATQDQGHRDGGGEESHRVGERACDEEHRSRPNRRVGRSEAALQEGIRGDELPLEIPWEECHRDDDAPYDVPCGDLQEREIAEVGECRGC